MSQRSRDPEKAKRAAADPDRPGGECRDAPGTWSPVVDRGRCEGKRDCEAVCPYQVFEVSRMTDEDFGKLGVLGKLRSLAHGRKTAYTPRAADCRGCGLCVVACPEDAVRLVRL